MFYVDRLPALPTVGLMNPYMVESWDERERTREESRTPTGAATVRDVASKEKYK